MINIIKRLRFMIGLDYIILLVELFLLAGLSIFTIVYFAITGETLKIIDITMNVLYLIGILMCGYGILAVILSVVFRKNSFFIMVPFLVERPIHQCMLLNRVKDNECPVSVFKKCIRDGIEKLPRGTYVTVTHELIIKEIESYANKHNNVSLIKGDVLFKSDLKKEKNSILETCKRCQNCHHKNDKLCPFTKVQKQEQEQNDGSMYAIRIKVK